MFDAPCFHGVVTLRYHRDFKLARQWGGAYVNVWVLAATEEEARRRIVAATSKRLRAEVVTFESMAPAVKFPNKQELHENSGEIRTLTDHEMAKAFRDNDGIIFTSQFVWRRKRWWQFWKSDSVQTS